MTEPSPERLRFIPRFVLAGVIRATLRTFSTPSLRNLYARAATELSPEAGRIARELIAKEVSRRTRKDY